MGDSPIARRLRPAERERRIVAGAAECFAERGFAASSRELAARLGVTQALLYRYFSSKKRLIEAVFRHHYLEHGDPAWSEVLSSREGTFAARLTSFYRAFSARGSAIALRLCVRANRDGLERANRYRPALTEQVLAPVIAALRRELSLPSLDTAPLLPDEREIALILHGSLILTRIRRDIYRAQLSGELHDPIGLLVQTFLPGALAQIALLHDP